MPGRQLAIETSGDHATEDAEILRALPSAPDTFPQHFYLMTRQNHSCSTTVETRLYVKSLGEPSEVSSSPDPGGEGGYTPPSPAPYPAPAWCWGRLGSSWGRRSHQLPEPASHAALCCRGAVGPWGTQSQSHAQRMDESAGDSSCISASKLAQAKRKRRRNKNKHIEMQKWKEQNNKTFLLAQISCKYWWLLVTSKQQSSLLKSMLFATSLSKRITAFMHD